MKYEVYKDRSEQATTALQLARAEVGWRRTAMLRESDSVWLRHEDLEADGVPSKEIVAEW